MGCFNWLNYKPKHQNKGTIIHCDSMVSSLLFLEPQSHRLRLESFYLVETENF